MVTKSQVKYIQSLGQKKFREQEGLFIAEGPKILNELLANSRTPLHSLFATREWLEDHPVPGGAVLEKLTEVTPSELERISFLTTPHQALGVFEKPLSAPPVDPQDRVQLMLDGIQDPGNLGTLVRIADWFGLRNIICSPDCADSFAPKVVQGSMGSVARVEIFYTELVPYIHQFQGIELIAATLEGRPPASFGHLNRGTLVIGSEGRGISPEIISLAKDQVTIPRKGQAESLNAAVAAGIILAYMAE